MNRLSKESAEKLQRILSKRTGRNLSDFELEQAYESLISFAEALVDLYTPPPAEEIASKTKSPIANNKEEVLQYV